MCSVTIVVVLAFAAQTHTTELAAKRTWDAQNRQGTSIENFVSNIIAKLFRRALKVSSVHNLHTHGATFWRSLELANPTNRRSLLTNVPGSRFSMSCRPAASPLRERCQPIANTIANGLLGQKRGQQAAKARPKATGHSKDQGHALITASSLRSPPDVTLSPTVRSACGDYNLRLLALTIEDGLESYSIQMQRSASDALQRGKLFHVSGDEWMLAVDGERSTKSLQLGSPDSIFAFALGGEEASAEQPNVKAAAPHWPQEQVDNLERRRISGQGTVVFDASTFLELLATSSFDRPLLFPNAANKLGMTGLERARALVSAVTKDSSEGSEEGSEQAFTDLMLRTSMMMLVESAERAGRTYKSNRSEGGRRGRLIAEWPDGEVKQIGETVTDGLHRAMGRGLHRVTFPADEPLGIGFQPVAIEDGLGAEIFEVDQGSAAERLGVEASMVLVSIEDPADDAAVGDADTNNATYDLTTLPFEEVLAAIDSRRDAGLPLTVVFDTALPVSHLYAVEMLAEPFFDALAAAEAQQNVWRRANVDASNVISRLLAEAGQPVPLWKENKTKAFIGEAGSICSAHVDIAPDLQLAHGLFGTKFVGVATHEATPRLLAEHAPEDELEGDVDGASTCAPTDRPLRTHETALLEDGDVSIALVLPGDLCVFPSSALHFASNGADGFNAVLYHGIVTENALPRLREAARRGSRGDNLQLSAEEVLRSIVGATPVET